jgi:hypothetical protein
MFLQRSSSRSCEWGWIRKWIFSVRKKVGKIIKFNKSAYESCFKKDKEEAKGTQQRNWRGCWNDAAETQEVAAPVKKVIKSVK